MLCGVVVLKHTWGLRDIKCTLCVYYRLRVPPYAPKDGHRHQRPECALGGTDYSIMVTMDERAPSFFEKLAVKGKKEPLVPIGALATVGFLVSGMAMFSKSSMLRPQHSDASAEM